MYRWLINKRMLVLIVILHNCLYVTTDPWYNMGQFRVTKAYNIPRQNVTASYIATTFCRCRNDCYETDGCRAFSFITTASGAQICSLSQRKCSLSELVAEPRDSHVGCKLDNFKGELQQDGHSYIYFKDMKLNYTEAEKRCTDIEGFNLGVYDTLTKMVTLRHYLPVENIEDGIWVALKKQGVDNTAYWRNGSSFLDSESAGVTDIDDDNRSDESVFRFQEDSFKDHKTSANFSALCQSVQPLL